MPLLTKLYSILLGPGPGRHEERTQQVILDLCGHLDLVLFLGKILSVAEDYNVLGERLCRRAPESSISLAMSVAQLFHDVFQLISQIILRCPLVREQFARPAWLHVLQGLRSIERGIRGTPQSEADFPDRVRAWETFGPYLGAAEEWPYFEGDNGPDALSSNSTQGCHWYKCPLHWDNAALSKRPLLLCSGCTKVRWHAKSSFDLF